MWPDDRLPRMGAASALELLRRRALPIGLCVLAGLIGAIALTLTATERYRAEARVFVNIPTVASVESGVQGVQLTSDLLPSYAALVTSQLVAERVRDRLDLDESARAISGKLAARAEAQTLIIEISATDASPRRAQELAEATTTALSDAVADLEDGRDADVAVELKVIDPPLLPTTPVEPRPIYNGVLGVLLGLAVGIVLALLLDALDRSGARREEGPVGSLPLASRT